MNRTLRGCRIVLAVVILAATASANQVGRCLGDCDGCGAVEVDELVLGASIALGRSELRTCLAFDDGSGTVSIAVLVRAVRHALDGCTYEPTPLPSEAATETATSTPTATPTASPSTPFVDLRDGVRTNDSGP